VTGLIGWWPLHDENGQASDLSGKDNHGSLNGGTIQGVVGKSALTAYSFDGNDDWVRIGHSSELSGMDALTVSFWMHVEEGQNSYACPLMKNDFSVNNPTRTYGFIFTGSGEDSSLRFQLDTSDTSSHQNVDTSTSNWTQGWYHVVGTYDGSQQRIYVNGKEENASSLTGSVRDDSYDIGIARQDGNSNQHFKGRMNDVRIYNRALSIGEIEELYDGGSGDYASPPNNKTDTTAALSRWKFDGDVSDSWGSNDGVDNTSAGFSEDAIRGKSKSFDGSDDNVTVGKPEYGQYITLSTWVKANRFGNSTGDFEGQVFNSSTGDSIVLSADETGVWRFRIYDSSSSTNYMIDTSGHVNEWTHIALVFEAGLMKLYKNGVEVRRNSTGISLDTSNNDDSIFGDINSTAERHFKGLLDDVRLYKKSLSENQVFQLYQWGTRGRDMRKLTINARGSK
jgi:hypothetical protein